ncbi:MAG: hypothetical protein V7711_17025, partial [Pseudomonadales bacterium]
MLRLNEHGEVPSYIKHPEIVFPHGLEVYQHMEHGECLLVTDSRTGLILMDLDGDITLFDGYGSYYATTVSPDGQ